jgi:SAM-dependent methyltransferase
MNTSDLRYRTGNYHFDSGDDLWNTREMRQVIERIPDIHTITSYADIGCGTGGVFVSLYKELVRKGFALRRAIGYDIASAWHEVGAKHPEVDFKTADFLDDDIELDLATRNDVIEHVSSPQTLLAGVARRCRYVALHVPITENCGGCLEPLLTGVPTIAGNVGGLPELVIDGVTGKTVAVRQRDELVHAILDVVSNPAYYRTLAEHGRQLVRTMFDVVRTSAEVHQVYEHILGRGPRPTPFNPQHTATALL